MAGATTYKVKTNIPLTGSVGSIYYSEATGVAKEKGWGDNICLYGDWNEGKGKVYLPLWCAEKLQEIGVIIGDKDGDGRYPVTQGQYITILRTEDGKKKHTEITLGGNGTAPQQATSAPVSPQKPKSERGGWKVIQDRFMAAYLIARKVLPEDTPPDVVQSATACVFIEANKQGLMPPEIKKPEDETE